MAAEFLVTALFVQDENSPDLGTNKVFPPIFSARQHHRNHEPKCTISQLSQLLQSKGSGYDCGLGKYINARHHDCVV